MRIFLFLIFFASPAFAQDGVRATDQVLNATEMHDLLNGQMLEFFDGSKSHYAADGTYSYTYTDDGPAWTGAFEVFDNSEVCVDFDNGSRRCDQFVLANDRTVLVTTDGLRFPVRNRTVYQQ
jgi:hypothetical protein